jgi:hypothetical protein
MVSCNNADTKNEPADTSTKSVAATSSNQNNEIAYTIVHGYFIKNDIANDNIIQPKIVSQQQFDQYFGAAATMGKNGKPTVIDFSKKFVIAIALQETDIDTKIDLGKLYKNEQGFLEFHYRLQQGKQQSFTIRPLALVVVDKSIEGEVFLMQDEQ